MNAELRPGERLDDLQTGGLRLIQKPGTFCFGTDSVLLADFAAPRRGERAADLGCGNGALTAKLAERGVIRPGGLFIAEMTAVQKAEETPGWVLVRDRTYGKTRICMWRRSVAS